MFLGLFRNFSIFQNELAQLLSSIFALVEFMDLGLYLNCFFILFGHLHASQYLFKIGVIFKFLTRGIEFNKLFDCFRESAFNILDRLFARKFDAGEVEVDKQYIYPIIICFTGLPRNTGYFFQLLLAEVIFESLYSFRIVFEYCFQHINQTCRLFLHDIQSIVDFLTEISALLSNFFQINKLSYLLLDVPFKL